MDVKALSPSSRAEWVEIAMRPTYFITVARSPSSRAEWVEIVILVGLCNAARVSVLAGGVG